MVVAKLGASTILHEGDVEAPNWMGALRAALEAMSERGAVPPGASCSIDAEGVATVLDPSSRRKYTLTPLAAGAGATPPQASPAAKPEPKPSQPAPAAVQPAPAQPAPPSPRVQPAATSDASKRKRFDTVGFADQAAAAKPAAAPAPAPATAAAPATAPAAPAPINAAPVDEPAPAPTPAAAVSLSQRPDAGSVRTSRPPMDLEPLLERDEDPTPENPLCYRERAFLLPKGMTVPEAEASLRWKLADMQRSLEVRPRGKFLNLAVFDHRWQQVPERPPVIVLQWRDWRGEVTADYPAAARVSSLPPPSRPQDDHLPEVFEALDNLPRLRTPVEGLDFAVRLLERTIPSEAISACLYDINTDQLRFVSLSGPNIAEVQGRAVPRSAGLIGLAARTEHRASAFVDVTVEPAFDPAIDSRPDLDARSMLVRPIARERELMGMLQLINRSGSSVFSAEDISTINYVAERLGEFLHHARSRVRATS